MKSPHLVHMMLLTFISLTSYITKAQTMSGTITCTLGTKPWNGTIQTALYSPQGDYMLLGFENDKSRIEITIRNIKKEILTHIPYSDLIEGEFKAGYSPDVIFFGHYFPDKKNLNNYAQAYTMLNAEFAVDALDLNKHTITVAFQMTCGKAKPSYNPMKPNEKDLDKLDILNAESTSITFITTN